MISIALFPLFAQPIFVGYLLALTAVIYLASKPKNEAINLYLAFIFRWSVFIVFTILSLIFITEKTLLAVFLLVYLNSTFNPKQLTV
ncbi:hypothetical protein OAH72_00325 [Gammaproteobacteria bacterium]|nr:hypothetical protein [Gammaproteobacteria bacterium]